MGDREEEEWIIQVGAFLIRLVHEFGYYVAQKLGCNFEMLFAYLRVLLYVQPR